MWLLFVSYRKYVTSKGLLFTGINFANLAIFAKALGLVIRLVILSSLIMKVQFLSSSSWLTNFNYFLAKWDHIRQSKVLPWYDELFKDYVKINKARESMSKGKILVLASINIRFTKFSHNKNSGFHGVILRQLLESGAEENSNISFIGSLILFSNVLKNALPLLLDLQSLERIPESFSVLSGNTYERALLWFCWSVRFYLKDNLTD